VTAEPLAVRGEWRAATDEDDLTGALVRHACGSRAYVCHDRTPAGLWEVDGRGVTASRLEIMAPERAARWRPTNDRDVPDGWRLRHVHANDVLWCHVAGTTLVLDGVPPLPEPEPEPEPEPLEPGTRVVSADSRHRSGTVVVSSQPTGTVSVVWDTDGNVSHPLRSEVLAVEEDRS
jgi:hypothetical protein